MFAYYIQRYPRPVVFCLSSVALLMLLSPLSVATPPPIASVMDELVALLCDGQSMESLAGLDDSVIREAVSPEQREILSTEYWTFEVDAPVIVSVMRHTEQEAAPFWLQDRGFEKTPLMVHNENYAYEVWQKHFPAGRIGLGINGFDRHRPHYFVGVGPQQTGDVITITNITPEPQTVYPFAEGATIYRDWPGLVLTEVPDYFDGHLLLPTIRGRAREAQLINVFRETNYPSSATPDMVTLTWSKSPETTQTIQWRASVTQEDYNRVHYRPTNIDTREDWQIVEADSVVLDDRNIINDRSVRWFTAILRTLKPGTEYDYAVGGSAAGPGDVTASFRTAPANKQPFAFLWMSDTHSNEAGIALLNAAWERHPETAFLTISGDLVGTGQQRDDWDQLFYNFAAFLKQRPIVPSIGNHDAIDGLGSELYRTVMALPDNGPEEFAPGKSYTLRYGDLLLISLDVTSSVAAQSDWLEETLRATDAPWKVAVLHFPPYAPTHDYEEIRDEWGVLFDRYEVDLSLSGHVHYYLRTWPLRDDERVEPGEGTVYLVSVAQPGRKLSEMELPYAEVVDFTGQHTCQAFVVEGDTLTMYAYTENGEVFDSFVLSK